jgi:hypothetical protein
MTYNNLNWVNMRDRATLTRFAYDAFDHEQRVNFALTLTALETLEAYALSAARKLIGQPVAVTEAHTFITHVWNHLGRAWNLALAAQDWERAKACADGIRILLNLQGVTTPTGLRDWEESR